VSAGAGQEQALEQARRRCRRRRRVSAGGAEAQAQVHGRLSARAGAREASRRRVSSTRARRCRSGARGVAAREQKRTGVAALEQA
jgi:hypothetical protein